MNRNELQQLSKTRIREAKVLLDAGLHSGAYYLAGYAVECALKACIAKHTQKYDFPDKKIVEASHTHDLAKLVGLAKIKPLQEKVGGTNTTFQAYWDVAMAWSEQSRYRLSGQRDAEELINAITNKQHGVMPWLMGLW